MLSCSYACLPLQCLICSQSCTLLHMQKNSRAIFCMHSAAYMLLKTKTLPQLQCCWKLCNSLHVALSPVAVVIILRQMGGTTRSAVIVHVLSSAVRLTMQSLRACGMMHLATALCCCHWLFSMLLLLLPRSLLCCFQGNWIYTLLVCEGLLLQRALILLQICCVSLLLQHLSLQLSCRLG